jgi:hypothetical protein
MKKALTDFIIVSGVVNIAEVKEHLISGSIALNAGTTRGSAIQTGAPITQESQTQSAASCRKGIRKNWCGLPGMWLDSLPP